MLTRFAMLAAVMVTATTGQASAQSNQESHLIMGQGTWSCGVWTEARSTKALVQYSLMQWVAGFLSAANAGVVSDKLITPYGPDILKGKDFEGLMAWVDNYCRAHPLDPIGTAAIALVGELRSRAQDR
jgi:hypothetical protein